MWPADVAFANHKRARSSTLRHRRRMGMSGYSGEKGVGRRKVSAKVIWSVCRLECGRLWDGMDCELDIVIK